MRAGLERARALEEREARLRPVAVALVLAKVHIDPAGELAAQDRVHHSQAEEIGRFAGRADLADGQDRLGGGRLVDQVDAAAAAATPAARPTELAGPGRAPRSAIELRAPP